MKLKQADDPPSVKVDINVIEPRARWEPRDGVDVPAQEVHETGPHGCSYVAHEHLHQKKTKKKGANKWKHTRRGGGGVKATAFKMH